MSPRSRSGESVSRRSEIFRHRPPDPGGFRARIGQNHCRPISQPSPPNVLSHRAYVLRRKRPGKSSAVARSGHRLDSTSRGSGKLPNAAMSSLRARECSERRDAANSSKRRRAERAKRSRWRKDVRIGPCACERCGDVLVQSMPQIPHRAKPYIMAALCEQLRGPAGRGAVRSQIVANEGRRVIGRVACEYRQHEAVRMRPGTQKVHRDHLRKGGSAHDLEKTRWLTWVVSERSGVRAMVRSSIEDGN
jgi:hypothetical protein